MRWLHESWCVGRRHLINPWSDKLGFVEGSARFCRNLKLLLSKKDHRTLVQDLLSGLFFLMRLNWEECSWQCLLYKKSPLALRVRAETLPSHHPTQFLMCRAVPAQVGGAALGLELQLPDLDSCVSLLRRSLLWYVIFSDLGTFSCIFPLWNQQTSYLPKYSSEQLENVFWETGSKNSHLVGQSIHHAPSKGNIQYFRKLVNSSSQGGVNMTSLLFCWYAHTPRCTQPCNVYWVTLSFPVQISSVLWND